MRVWRGAKDDSGDIHALGNGRMCAYGQGPDLIQVFGPPYSSPSMLAIRLSADRRVRVESQRERGAAIWRHTLMDGNKVVAEITDWIDAELPCLVRQIDARRRIALDVVPAEGVSVIGNSDRFRAAGATGALLLQAPAGTYFYHEYPFPQPIWSQMCWCGPAEAWHSADDGAVRLIIEPGTTRLLVAGGPAYPDAVLVAEAALRTPAEQMLERTDRWWQAFTGRRRDLASELAAPAGSELPERERLLQTADDVAVLIKVQQATEGAVLAGHNYHMGYVRDQYGVARGLLSLGHYAEAQAILDFYWGVWQRHGMIRNAQAPGVDGAFHVHENDDVEITGYLIRQAFDLADRIGDPDLPSRWAPMLEWAFEAQKRHLVDGMLPFNGDETYVAGGILPRDTLSHGSAEATLLFLESGGRWLEWLSARDLWTTDRLAEDRALLSQVRGAYRERFWRDGHLITNNPQREALLDLPRFRHGVCEGCLAKGVLVGITWTERSDNGRYLCPACIASGDLPASEPIVYALQSVALTPFYFGSTLLGGDDLRAVVDEIVARYQETGALPSRPGGGDDHVTQSVGYDYGLLLYALTELGHPLARELYERTLSLVDQTGAWVEYYRRHTPSGTRCRPWESAINLEATLHWADRYMADLRS